MIRIKLTEKDIVMDRTTKFAKPQIIIPCNRETDFQHLKNQILQDQEKVKRLDEILKRFDERLEWHKKMANIRVSPHSLDMIVEIEKIRDGK